MTLVEAVVVVLEVVGAAPDVAAGPTAVGAAADAVATGKRFPENPSLLGTHKTTVGVPELLLCLV